MFWLLVKTIKCNTIKVKLHNTIMSLKSSSLQYIWFLDAVFSSELLPRRYKVLRCDRKLSLVDGSSGGVVAITLANNILYNIVDTSFMVCKCDFGPFSFFFFAAIYIAPNISCTELEIFWDALESLILDILNWRL